MKRYTRYKTGENPIVASAEIARRQFGDSGYWRWCSWFAALTLAPLVSVLAWVTWRAARNDTRRNQP